MKQNRDAHRILFNASMYSPRIADAENKRLQTALPIKIGTPRTHTMEPRLHGDRAAAGSTRMVNDPVRHQLELPDFITQTKARYTHRLPSTNKVTEIRNKTQTKKFLMTDINDYL